MLTRRQAQYFDLNAGTERTDSVKQNRMNLDQFIPKIMGIFSVASVMLSGKLMERFVCCDLLNKTSFYAVLLFRNIRGGLCKILLLSISVESQMLGFCISGLPPQGVLEKYIDLMLPIHGKEQSQSCGLRKNSTDLFHKESCTKSVE